MQKILKEMNISADFSEFDKYSEMLLSANEVMNLTAITDPEEVKIRHFADSLSLLSCYDFSDKKVIDVGCGAGFPGLPLKLGEKSIKLKGIVYCKTGTILKQVYGGKKNARKSN